REVADVDGRKQSALQTSDEIPEVALYGEAFDGGELVAACARDELPFSQKLAESLADELQSGVARFEAAQIVDLLEAIEIYADDGHAAAVSLGELELPAKMVCEAGTVRQAR